jgi:hypothetical protein
VALGALDQQEIFKMGNKLARKLKRKNISKKRRDAQKDMNEKVGLFFELPEECNACSEPFDKMNREMVSTWNVVVKNEEKIVRVYCPDCWERAQELIEDIKNRGVKIED